MLLKKREQLERAQLFTDDTDAQEAATASDTSDVSAGVPGAMPMSDSGLAPFPEQDSPTLPQEDEKEQNRADTSVVSIRRNLQTAEEQSGVTPATWLNEVFTEAVRLEASDIHIVPEKDYLSVRFRLNGIIHEVAQWGIEFHDTVLSRLKVISGLQVVEKNIPQDGRLELFLEDTSRKNAEGEVQRNLIEFNFRVSTMPTINGEAAVLRALNKERGLQPLDAIGLSQKSLLLVKKTLRRGYGVFLITGHSGSGKTTTLYSILNYLNDKNKAILTLEDPVEYRLQNVRQSQINPQLGLTFDLGLKAILRQDPDMIMIGEIRDEETAETAMRLALVGRLVLTSLHTNSINGALVRLSEMDIERSIISAALTAVVAERLVRKICDKCRVQTQPPEDLLQMFNVQWTGEPVYKGAGCEVCHQTGYSGRVGIFEVFEVDDTFRDMIIRQNSPDELGKYISAHVSESLRDDGFAKVRRGITTLEEVIQATI